jgi:septum formation protein
MARKRPLILASSSPRRRELLRSLKIPFRVIPSRIAEESDARTPRALVLDLALRKALSVAEGRKTALVLGADTVVVFRGQVITKPADAPDSRRILRSLNGRWHRVVTGVALVDSETGKSWREAAVSRVKARRLKPCDLERFVGRHPDKAGAYAVQDSDDPFIERIVGPRDNVVGLPLANVRSLLRRALRDRRRR